MKRTAAPRVLLVGPMSGGALVGGVENGIALLLGSPLARDWRMAFFNSYRDRQPGRPRLGGVVAQLGAYARFAATLARVRPRIVHVKAAEGANFVQAIGFLALARAARARTLLQIHGGSFDRWYEEAAPPLRALIRFGLGLPQELIVLSAYWGRFVQGVGTRRPVHVIPNGVDVACAQPASPGGGAPLRVVTIGALGERKGHFDIVDAAALCRDLPLRFVFAGPDEFGGEGERLAARIAALGLADRIELPGAVAGDAKWRLLAAADLFLFPSHNENMPNALLEAMAAGVPIVCTAVGAVREMVDAAGARFVPVGDPAAIAAAVRELVVDPATLRRMGAANRARAADGFALDRVLPRLDAVYQGAA